MLDRPVCMVIGGAECVWADIDELERMIGGPWTGPVVAVNDIGIHWPGRLDAWASLHAEKFRRDPMHPQRFGWLKQRELRGHPGNPPTWSREGRYPSDRHVGDWIDGSSGLLGLAVARDLGFRAVACGIPMTSTPHFAESTTHLADRPWRASPVHWKGWARRAEEIRAVARSMSGRTRDLIGAPDLEWLEGVAR